MHSAAAHEQNAFSRMHNRCWALIASRTCAHVGLPMYLQRAQQADVKESVRALASGSSQASYNTSHSYTMISCGDALQVVVYNQRPCTPDQAALPRS